MTSGMLQMQDSLPSPPSPAGPRFRPYASPNHQVTKGRYITSNDPRGYIPVYEYPLNGQWIMMDIDDGYILWTGIWKALGNSKADIVKMIDSQPDLAPLIRRVRGGYLKIQGTWMPYEVALRLSRRVAWPIRDDLIPLFGPTFPSTCLSPDQPGYGQVVSTGTGRRRTRRSTQLVPPTSSVPRHAHPDWTVATPITGRMGGSTLLVPSMASVQPRPSSPIAQINGSPYPPPRPPHSYVLQPTMSFDNFSSHNAMLSSSSIRERSNRPRYSPYPGSSGLQPRKPSPSSSVSVALDIPSLSLRDRNMEMNAQRKLVDERITLPPVQPPSLSRNMAQPSYALPPISALEDLRGISSYDSVAVLHRLKMDDDIYSESSSGNDQSWATQSPHALPSRQQAVGAPSFSHSYVIEERADRSVDDRKASFHFHGRSPHLSPNSMPSSYEGSSTPETSSVSPTTPHSLDISSRIGGSVQTLLGAKEPSRRPHQTMYDNVLAMPTRDSGTADRKSESNFFEDPDPSLSAHRYSSCIEEDNGDHGSLHPIRPWQMLR